MTEFTKEDIGMVQAAYEDLLEAAKKRVQGPNELEMIKKAFEFANEAHKGVRRRSGEPYIMHPLAVAKIVVSEIGLGYKSIVAALLHDVVEDTDYTIDDIKAQFNEKIASLVDGLTKIKVALNNEDTATKTSLQAENFKRILYTLNDDIRVVLIKLADRLHNIRTIGAMPEYKRDKILGETMYIFIPLAHRLGLYGIKSEMEDTWLRYKEPEAYRDITEKLADIQQGNFHKLDKFVAPIEDALKEAGISYTILKRLKSPYSIWYKIKTKGVSFDQIYDLFAVRIIYRPDKPEKEISECFEIYTILKKIFPPRSFKQDRYRDWVGNPKSNGYEALHCTIMCRDEAKGFWVEVQIRSERMNDIAEKGIAAHWLYKKDGVILPDMENEMDTMLQRVREIINNPDASSIELLDEFHKEMTSPNITVFTPKGEQRTLIKGATALDYAYQIHTQIGNTAIAAKINQKLYPLSQELRSGDQVEIITADNAAPKAEWLEFLKTAKAINIVKSYLKGEKQEYIDAGMKTVEQKLHECGLKFSEKNIKLLYRGYKLNTAEDLYFNVGSGMLSLSDIEYVLKRMSSNQSWFSWFRNPFKNDNIFVDEASKGMNFVISPCCNPIPGDPIIGFKDTDNVIHIHKKSCKKATELESKQGYTIVKDPVWNTENRNHSYPARISVYGMDRLGILSDVTKYISFVMGVNIRHLDFNSNGGVFTGDIDLLVTSKKDLDTIIKKLTKIDGIEKVRREDIVEI